MLFGSSKILPHLKNKIQKLIDHIDDEYDHWLVYEHRSQLKITLAEQLMSIERINYQGSEVYKIDNFKEFRQVLFD